MYVAIRPALRSSSRARPARLIINGRRYPQPHRVQSFHSTRSLAHTPTPTPSPDNTTSNADKKGREKEKATAADNVEAPEAIEDPEILAQKLQRSRELARRYSSALRRSQRRNRSQGLPPIYIPDWFLEGRVRLREDANPQRALARRSDCTLELKHKASGEHGSLAIPVSTYAAAFKAISGIIKALWRQGLSKEHREMLARDFARRMGREDDEEFVKALERGEEPRVGLWQEAASASPDATSGSQGEEDITMELKMRKKLLQDGRRISPLLLAEIRATMAASLSTIQPATTHSFPAARTNLILHSPSNDYETVLHSTVQMLASEFGADVVTLNAQDLAQIAGDYLGEGPEPSPFSIRALGYETYRYGPTLAEEMDLWPKAETVTEEEADAPLGIGPLKFHIVWKEDGKRSSQASKRGQSPTSSMVEDSTPSPFQASRGQSTSEVQLEDLKLSTILEALVDTNELKRTRAATATTAGKSGSPRRPSTSAESKTKDQPQLFDYSFGSGASELDFSTALPADAQDSLTFTMNTNPPPSGVPSLPRNPKIIYVKDIKELNATQYGSRIMQKLEEIVRKQRNAGESVMLLGTTCSEDLTPEVSPSGFHQLQSDGADGFYRTIVVTPGSVEEDASAELKAMGRAFQFEMGLSTAEKKKFRDINLRHIHDMLRCLDPQATANLADLQRNREGLRNFSSTIPQQYFWSVLSYDSVHRVALTALGLRLLDSNAEQLSWAHVTLAMGLLQASDQVKYNFANFHASDRERQDKEREAQQREHMDRLKSMFEKPSSKSETAQAQDNASSSTSSSSPRPRKKNLAAIEKSLNPYEKRLFPGIVDPEHTNTTFDKIHVPQETVEAIRAITSMSLLRPDAFNYGILAAEKISGALLYGPPGTGKTLLAKAVAKESGSTMLEISGSQIMDKYVGEGEKNVAAAFSLARKLSPCVLFLDEADAIFCTRDTGHERGGHRDVLNQFLKEWDGLRDMSVFVMVATNRPFDMDDAVIRRLPRRLLVDLPKQEDRKEILKIHLRGEEMAPEVDLDDLAKRTPLYSGSDLKNVVVFAALAAVREENEIAAVEATKRIAELAREAGEATMEGETAETAEVAADSGASTTTTTAETETEKASTTSSTEAAPKNPPILTAALANHYTFPPRRILQQRHFDKALQEVSASISENMHSLNAIKKFDETYGDRRGRKKKTTYGFGVPSGDDAGSIEEAARVRR